MTYQYANWVMESIKAHKIFTTYDIFQDLKKSHNSRSPSLTQITQYLRIFASKGHIEHIDTQKVIAPCGHVSEVKLYRYNGD